MSILSVDGTNLLSRFQNATLNIENSDVDVSSPLADYKRGQTVFQEVSLSATVFEDASSGVRATGRDLVITFNGDDLCPIFKNGTISLANDVSNEKGACSGYAYNQATDSDLNIEFDLYTNTGAAETIFALAADTDYTSHIVALSLNLGNGTTIAGNFKLNGVSDEVSAGAVNTRKVKFRAHDMGSGTYPTTPSTDNSWLNGVIMNPRATVAVSVALDNEDHVQVDFTGVYESVEVNIPQSGAITASMSLKSQGAFTVTPN